MHALLDGDIVAYRCAAVTENNDGAIAKWQADELIQRILSDVNASTWQIYISGDNNFRSKLYPDYKANRRDKPKPKHLELLREHLVTKWDTIIADGYEADDALGIESRGCESVIASIDKDLLQLSGRHYNFVNRSLLEIDEITGWRNFYQQLLIGDISDNIRGCPGIGKVKAARLLEQIKTPMEMYEICLAAYLKAKVSIEQMHLNAQLLYILRSEDDSWKPPVEEQQEKAALL